MKNLGYNVSDVNTWNEIHSKLTPIVNSIDTSNPASIKLTGSGFDSTNNTNNQVFIGTTQCVVTSSSSTIIYCTPGLTFITI